MRRLWKNRCSPSSFPGTVSSRSFASAARRKPSNDGIAAAAAAAAADAAPSPSPKVLKIVEDIANLTLLEAADMSLLLKKRLRIQNVPVMSMGMNVMHDMWYDPLPLSPGPPPPPLPRRSLPSSKRILPEEVHLNHGFLDDGEPVAAAATRSIHASISEEDKYLYQLPSASSDNDTDYEHDPDRGDEEDDEEAIAAMPKAKADTPAAAAKNKVPAAKADAASKAKARKVKLVEGAVPSLAPPAADQKPGVKKPAAKKASPKPKKPAAKTA